MTTDIREPAHDPIRERIRDLLRQRDLTMANASVVMGRNRAYLHQFLERGLPKVLGYRDSEVLAGMLGCDAGELRHETVPRRKPAKRKPRRRPPLGAPLAAIPEIEVAAGAGPGALNEEFAAEKACWYLPESMVRHESGADPEHLRILRVRGNSMEPEMSEGDRLMVDTAQRVPITGEMFVLWDGNGLVVKRTETMREAGPPRLQLLSANPDYAPYTCLAEAVHIVGKVLWTLKRV